MVLDGKIRKVARIRLPVSGGAGATARLGLWAAQSGASAIEFALTAPLLFMLMFGIVEGGRMLWCLNQLQTSVVNAAHWGVVNSSTTAQIQAYAANQVQSFPVNASQFTVTPPAGTTACGLTVTASVPYTPIFIPGGIQPILGASFCQPGA